MLRLRSLSGLGLALSLPIVSADSKDGKQKEPKKPSQSHMVKPSQLSVYDKPQDIYSFEYHGKESCKLVEGISVARKEVKSAYDSTAETREFVQHIYETGKAHSMATVDLVLDEESVAAKVGVISIGGLLGLLILGRKKGLIKKVFYTSVAATGAAAAVYPKETTRISKELYDNSEDYAVIAYNFVTGAKPQNDTKSPAPSDTQQKKPSAPVTPEVSSPAQNKNGGNTTLNSMARQSSDVTLWGFRLFDRGDRSHGSGKGQTESTIPERVSAVARDGFEETKDKGELIRDVAKDVVEDLAAFAAQEVTETVEKDVKEISNDAAVVEEGSKKVETVLSVVETVAEATEKAAKHTDTAGISKSVEEKAKFIDTAAKKLTKIVSATEKVSEKVEQIADVVSKVAESVDETLGEFRVTKEKDITENVKEIGKKLSEKNDSSAAATPNKPAPKDVVIKPAPTTPTQKIEGDIGQSNPADKDMYTTRG